jgi:hypothetical protein
MEIIFGWGPNQQRIDTESLSCAATGLVDRLARQAVPPGWRLICQPHFDGFDLVLTLLSETAIEFGDPAGVLVIGIDTRPCPDVDWPGIAHWLKETLDLEVLWLTS